MKKSQYCQQNNFLEVQRHPFTRITTTQPKYCVQIDTSCYSISRSTSIITKRLDEAQQRLQNISKSISKSKHKKQTKKTENSDRIPKNKLRKQTQYSHTPHNEERQKIPQLRNKKNSIRVKGFETDSSNNQNYTQEKHQKMPNYRTKGIQQNEKNNNQIAQLQRKFERKTIQMRQLQKEIEQIKNHYLHQQSSLLRKQTNLIKTIHALEDRIMQIQHSQIEAERRMAQEFDKYRLQKQERVEQLQRTIEQQSKQFERLYQKGHKQEYKCYQQSLILQTQRKSLMDSPSYSSLIPISHRCIKCQKKNKIIEWLSENYRTLADAIKNWSDILNRQELQRNKKSPLSKRKIELPITVLMMQEQMHLRNNHIQQTLNQIDKIKVHLKKDHDNNIFDKKYTRKQDKQDYPFRKSESVLKDKQNNQPNGKTQIYGKLNINKGLSRISDSKTNYSVSHMKTVSNQSQHDDSKSQTNELFQVILAQAQLLEQNNVNTPFSRLIKARS